MSQQSKTTLQSAINTQIADNTSGNITAADIRNNLINTTDSLVFNTGSQAITGSLNVTGGITGSLFGTASFALGAAIKTLNNQSLLGTGNISITSARARIVGSAGGANASSYVTQINFGAIALAEVIDIDIQCKTATAGSTTSIRLYASENFGSITGAIQLATYNIASGSVPPLSGRFIRRLRGWSFFYSSEGDTYGGYHIETLDPAVSALNDFSSSGSLVRTPIGAGEYQYLIAVVINPAATVEFASWVVEYGT